MLGDRGDHDRAVDSLGPRDRELHKADPKIQSLGASYSPSHQITERTHRRVVVAAEREDFRVLKPGRALR
jgi:hypothetical protein